MNSKKILVTTLLSISLLGTTSSLADEKSSPSASELNTYQLSKDSSNGFRTGKIEKKETVVKEKDSTEDTPAKKESAIDNSQITESLLPSGTKTLKDLAEEDKAKKLYNEKLTYENFKNDLDRFTSKVYFPNDFFGFSSETNYLFNSMVQGVFWINKLFFSMTATVYESISKTGKLDDQIIEVINISGDVYKSLVSGDIIIFLGGLFVSYAWVMYIKGRAGFFTSLVKLFVVFGITTAFFTKAPNGDYYLARTYNNVSSAVTNVANQLSSFNGVYGSSAYGGDSSATVLDAYFMESIWKPYVFMNADKVSDNPLYVDEKHNISLNVSEENLRLLLGYDADDKNFKLKDKEGKEVAIQQFVYDGDKPLVKNLSNAWGTKFSYAFGSITKTVVLGIIIDALAIVDFVYRIMLALLFFLSPFVAVIALIPTMQIVLTNFGKKVGTLIALSGFMSFFTIGLLYLWNIVELTIQSVFVGNYLLTVFLEVIVMVMLWKKRDWVMSIVTADRLRINNKGRSLSRFKRRFKGAVRTRRNGGHSLANDMTKMALARNAVRGLRRRAVSKVGTRFKSGVANMYRGRQLSYALAGGGFENDNVAKGYARSKTEARKTFLKRSKASFSSSIDNLRHAGLMLAKEGANKKQANPQLDKRLKNAATKRDTSKLKKELYARRQNRMQQRMTKLAEHSPNKRLRQEKNKVFVQSVLDKKKGTDLTAKQVYKQQERKNRIAGRSKEYILSDIQHNTGKSREEAQKIFERSQQIKKPNPKHKPNHSQKQKRSNKTSYKVNQKPKATKKQKMVLANKAKQFKVKTVKKVTR
ncbi:hypothetical protein [Streptococcus sp. zg-JUN1979]|uniref:hypothetical protein n=1 Tax=Streptococcus sp. zg-JUN1979 TaxID=3391450 RepID=UPI0039A6CAC9